MNDYPKDWPDIAKRIKDRAGWHCENCHRPNSKRENRVLTVHHLDGDKANCADDNLVALCQVCHLSVQGKFSPSQITMPGFEPYPWMSKRGL